MFIIYLLIFISILIFVISTITFKLTFLRSKKESNMFNLPISKVYDSYKDFFSKLILELDNLKCEDIYIKSHDGLKLHGRYYHIKDNAPICICFHGYRSSSSKDFCCGIKMCFENEFNVLLVDHRAHGKSSGQVITFGIKERYDCLDWINYIDKKFPDSKIFLFGISMGASTAIMSAPLITSQKVAGIIADCPYSSPKQIIKKIAIDMKLPCNILYPFIYLGALLFGRFNINEFDCFKAVKTLKIPTLLIHGESDSFTPCQMSKDLKKYASENLNLILFPKADHGLSYLSDEKKYKQVVKEFINNL